MKRHQLELVVGAFLLATNGLVFGGTFNGAPDFGGGPLTANGDPDLYMASLTAPGYEAAVPGDLPATTARVEQNVPNPFNPSTSIFMRLCQTKTFRDQLCY